MAYPSKSKKWLKYLAFAAVAFVALRFVIAKLKKKDATSEPVIGAHA